MAFFDMTSLPQWNFHRGCLSPLAYFFTGVEDGRALGRDVSGCQENIFQERGEVVKKQERQYVEAYTYNQIFVPGLASGP